MDFVNFVMALSPILVVLVGILGFKQSAKRVSPIALVWTLILAFTYFNVTGASFADNVKTLDPWSGRASKRVSRSCSWSLARSPF